MANDSSRSSKIWLTLGVFAVAAGGIYLAVNKPWADPPPVTADELAASIELAAGEVTVQVGDEQPQRVLTGTPLPSDAQVVTGPGARAMIRLGDGARVFLDGDSTARVGAGVEVTKGRAWLDAPAPERDREPTVHKVGDVTLTLAGGGASLTLNDKGSTIYVADGLAVVTGAGGRSEVESGEQVVVAGNAAPKVEPVAFWDDWTGGMGDRGATGRSASEGSGSLYAVDRQAEAGAPALPLSIERQSVNVVVRDGVAETVVDQSFFNPSGRPVEGYYSFTIPEGSQLVSFALETNGVLVEGEIVERSEAKAKYEAAVQRAVDPALLEWIDERTVRARIFPVPALGSRRTVVRYQQLLSETEGKIRYRYPLAAPAGKNTPPIEEFALAVDLGDYGKSHAISTLAEARVEDKGRRVTMRRSGYTPRADFELELARKESSDAPPLRVNRLDAGSDQAGYVMVRWNPDMDFNAATAPVGEVVVVVDTSAGGDASEQHTKLAVAEAFLHSLSKSDRFAVISADVTATTLFPDKGLAAADRDSIAKALEKVAAHGSGGATDLGAVFEQALERLHGLQQPAIVYIGDGLVTSGERSGEQLAERLRRSMVGSRARLFTIGVGDERDEAMLARLARVGGGAHLRVDAPEQAVVRALELSGSLKTPTITDLEIDLGEGLDDVFTDTAGKLSRGDEMVLLARTHHDLPDEVTIRGRLGGEEFEKTYDLKREANQLNQLVPKLWAAAYVDRLLGDDRGPQAVRGKILSLGLEYGLMTPYTSYLALENEAAYAQMGVQRRNRRFGGVRLSADASRSHLPDDDGPVRGSGVLAGIAAAATAPLGCSMSSPEEPPAAAKSESAPESKPTAAASPATVDAPAQQDAAKNQAGGGASDDMAPGRFGAKGGEAQPAAMPEVAGKAARRVDMDEMEEGLAALPPPAPPQDARDRGRGSGNGYRGEGDMAPVEEDIVPLGGVAATRALKKKVPAKKQRPRPVSPIARGLEKPCSDASARPLSHRKVLWGRRLKSSENMYESLSVFEASAASCEIKGWRDQRVYLQMLQQRAVTEGEIELLLAHFSGELDAQRYLARALLRRLVDPTLVGAVHRAIFGDDVNWNEIDRVVALEPDVDKKLELVEQALAARPGDPEGEVRLLELLARAGRLEAAAARGKRLREQGLMTPLLAEELGEVLVLHKRSEAAKRVFSEIVEFDADSPSSRRLLGDIFFRHGWFDDAYRQYEDLLRLVPDDAFAAIAVARAAAGAGRVDEALRRLRQVASGEGRPGPEDPRRFARLHAAVYLAGVLSEGGAKKAAVSRELRRLQLFDEPVTWTVVVWEDLRSQLVLAPAPDSETAPATDAVDATRTGLFAVPRDAADMVVRHRGVAPTHAVSYSIVKIIWDGKAFKVERESKSLAPPTL